MKPITAKEILECKDFDKFVKDKVKNYLSKNKNHLELIDVTLSDLLAHIEKQKPTDQEAKNISDFVELLPPDMGLKFITEGSTFEQNFTPVMLTLIPEEKSQFSINLMEAMGYENGTIMEAVGKVTELMDEVKKELEDRANNEGN